MLVSLCPETPFFSMHLGWGAHFTEMGWPPFPRFLRGMIDTKRPFIYRWQVRDRQPVIRKDQSVPAFSNCSLDNNPGNGDPAEGDYYGQINGYLLWDDRDQVDQPGHWEMTVFLADECPRDRCTVDLTPRHCRRFKPRAGERFAWTNTTADGGRVASGQVTADQWGLVTIKNLPVSKAKHRVVIQRK